MPYEAVRLGGAVLGLSFGSNPSQNQSLQWQKWPPLRLPLGDDSAGRTPTFGFKLPILQGKSMFRKMGFTITLFGLVGGLLATEPQPPRRIGRIVEGVVGRSVNFADRIVQAATGEGFLDPATGKAASDGIPVGFTALFNGKDLAGWHGMPHHDPYKLAALAKEDREKLLFDWTADAKKHWSVANGELINDGHGAYLTTDRELGDIEFVIDYKTVAQADSGIYLRATPQIQIWDYTKEGGKWNIGADKGSGGLWNNSPGTAGKDPMVLADKPFGQWNRFRILQVGDRTTVYLNDKLVVKNARMENFWDRKKPLLARAPIQLQTHGGEIRWKNIGYREIGAAEANKILRGNDSGFEKVFNGTDFTGWKGPIANYEIKDGAVVCKPGKGGTIHTEKEYTDFVARVEYKLPPGGNNGLAIRYPGEGDTAYKGMCEIQVLDDTAKMYATLDPRQYNGSAYGMTAVTRGYLRPVGEWNLMEVTVNGSTIKIELNGAQVLDTDLAKVTTYMANSPHPGKDNKKGFFGLAGHSDPVPFRTVEIKSLAK